MPLLSKHQTLTFLLLVAGVALAVAQTAQPSNAIPGVQKPAAAETQPPLDVDRDPVLSPDADDNLGVSPKTPPASSEPSAPKGPVKPNAVTRGANGTFTIRQNVEEVVLNATVLDN
ncbi:MAG TPA: hypothetical protein VNX22_01885, partial [Acidobacteriaceae bacterium]|nr:hypothetical protein [Acidobacteriaceae bacterium]